MNHKIPTLSDSLEAFSGEKEKARANYKMNVEIMNGGPSAAEAATSPELKRIKKSLRSTRVNSHEPRPLLLPAADWLANVYWPALHPLPTNFSATPFMQ